MSKVKVLYISQEIKPFLPSSEVSKTVGLLSQSMQSKGKEVRVFMPRYGNVNERRHQLHEVIRLSGMNIIIDDNDHSLIIKVASVPQTRMQVYFIDNEDYFDSKEVVVDENGDLLADNDEKAMFFSHGVLETVKKLGWKPDVIHCHGWLAGLLPLYLKKHYNEDPHFSEAKIVTSLYSEGFNGSLDKRLVEKLVKDGFEEKDISLIKDPTFENIQKLAVDYSDGVVLTSKEIESTLEEYVKTDDSKLILDNPVEEEAMRVYSEFYDEIAGVSSSVSEN